MNARDRIGKGPWHNVKGVQIAADVAQLHGDTIEAARLGNNLSRTTVMTEKGEPVKGAGDQPNQHDILTGSQTDGRAFTDGADHTCANWTSNAAGSGRRLVTSIAPAAGHPPGTQLTDCVPGCSQANLVGTGGAGLLYCFATGEAR